jgi:GWxTD domain-containing protein
MAVVVWSGAACYYYRLEQKLDPINKEWLRQVGYIITAEERKLFLDLPAAEKDEFKEEFWRRRDPDPSTEENEFKQEYMARLERANEIFISEGRPGYLTDRGRIYILFGPPTDRITYPSEGSGRAQEIWYYGNFPVVFVDKYSTGQFELISYDLTSLRQQNLMYMHELGRAQSSAQQTIVGESDYLNFDWDVELNVTGPDRLEGEVRIEVSLTEVWFTAEGERLQTVLDLRLEIRDAENRKVWEHEQAFELTFEEEELRKIRTLRRTLSVPLTIDVPLDGLRKGTNRIFAELTNRTDERRLQKVKTFTLNGAAAPCPFSP